MTEERKFLLYLVCNIFESWKNPYYKNDLYWIKDFSTLEILKLKQKSL